MNRKTIRFLTMIVMFSLLLLAEGINTKAQSKSESLIASGEWGDNLTWQLLESGELVVSGNGEMMNASDEAVYPWKQYRKSIEEIVISEGVLSVGYNAFSDLPYLNSVEIADSVVEIGEYCFNSCKELEFANLPENIMRIGEGAFSDCWSLLCVQLGDKITRIEERTFYNTNLVDVKLGENITYIGENAFYGCQFMHVVFAGSENQWNNIDINGGNEYLLKNARHYNGEGKVTMDYRPATCEYTKQVEFECDACDLGTSFSYGTPLEHQMEICDVVEPTCVTDGYTIYECTMCWKEFIEDEIEASGHSYVNNFCEKCFKSVDLVESLHPYKNQTDETWVINKEDAFSITIAFDDKTYVEAGYDFIYIFDGKDELIGCYTGSQLAGKTIKVYSDIIKIRLVANSSVEMYGFAVADVKASDTVDIYAVTYNANGGSGAPNSQIKYHDKNLTLRTKVPTRANHVFQGWATTKTATKPTYKAGGTYKANKSVTLYAVWKKKQTITASNKSVVYKCAPFSLKAKASGGGKLTYKSGNTKVATVSSTGVVTVKGYGKATITINAAAKENYLAATKKITVTVKPKKMTLKSVSSPVKKKLNISWGKISTVTGYEVQFSTKKNFSSNTYKRTFGVNKTSTTIVGVPGKKTYYVRVRAYKTVSGTKYYGAWSTVKSVWVK